MFNPDVETMSRQGLNALQTARLKQTLDRAYTNVAHYRKKFDAAGVSLSVMFAFGLLVRWVCAVCLWREFGASRHRQRQ